MVDERQPSPDTQQSNGWLKKTLLLAVVAGVGGTLYWLLRDVLSLEYLASQEAQMRAWQVDFPMITAMVAVPAGGSQLLSRADNFDGPSL